MKTVLKDLHANTRRTGDHWLDYVMAWLLTPGFTVVLLARLAAYGRKKSGLIRLISRMAQRRIVKGYGCYISPLAVLGDGLGLPHPIGVVIGDGVEVGNNVTIYQNVTLGRARHDQADYPRIEDNVVIYAGAAIVGNIKIGEGSVVGANSVVVRDVPAYSTVFGVPARTKQ